MKTLTIKPSVDNPLSRQPYPIYVDFETLVVKRQDIWQGNPNHLVGFINRTNDQDFLFAKDLIRTNFFEGKNYLKKMAREYYPVFNHGNQLSGGCWVTYTMDRFELSINETK